MEHQENDNKRNYLPNCKIFLKAKIAKNIDIRILEVEKTINHAISTLLGEYTNMEIRETALCQDGKIKGISIAKQEINKIKNKFESKVDEWKGLRDECKDYPLYKKLGDNWWNRYKAQWFGDYLFYALLQENGLVAEYIKKIIHYDRKNPPSAKTYDLIYFRTLSGLIRASLPFPNTQYMALIPIQAFIPLRCKNTLQKLFTSLADQHRVPYNNTKIV